MRRNLPPRRHQHRKPVTAPRIHPIEAESYRLLEGRVDLSHLQPAERAVVARVIHATADVSFASSIEMTPGAVESALTALRNGNPVVTDVEMVRAGIPGVRAE